ncbi:MAG TPA: hypothetical protein VF895_11090 [Gaiellaceae bacterium]
MGKEWTKGAVACIGPFLLGFVAALAFAGCGGESKSSAGGTLPDCVRAGEDVVDLFELPRPEGTIFDRRGREFGRNVVQGYVPGDLQGVRDFFQRELPRHGYELGEGDAEEHEAETDFEGNGVKGHLKLHDIADCDGAVSISIAYGND